MDSKLLLRVSLIVTSFAVFVCVLMLGLNGYLSPKQAQKVNEAVQTDASPLEEDGMVKGANLTAWMSDETFFDEEKSSTMEKIEENAGRLTLLGSSVEKDIRLYVLDGNGEKISGIPFQLKIEKLGTFQDTDEDGVLYIENVKPGDYLVSIKDVDGFSMPEDALTVKVKAEVEYKQIDDISYLIKTEDEINAKADDTAIKDAALQSEGTSEQLHLENAAFGIDVSKWNKEIDWKQVKAAGVEFAMIRAGYRGSTSGFLVEDPYFRKNMEEALANDIKVGVYFFTQATSEREAVEEASMVLSLIEPYHFSYPVMIDSEGAGGKGRADHLDVKVRSRAVEAFCKTIRSAGYTSGIYASKNWFNNNLDITKFSEGNVIWLAEYQPKPTYGGKYSMWQYTSSGRLPGIEGRVDFNQSFVDFANKVEKQDSDNLQAGPNTNGTDRIEDSEEQLKESKQDTNNKSNKISTLDEDPERKNTSD